MAFVLEASELMRTWRRGFTMIELLIVIAVIAVIVALLLPAVAAVREAARRAQCQNNLSQIAIALQNYEQSFGAFPPGCVNPTGPIKNRAAPGDYHVSWTVQILPYLELGTVFKHFDFDGGVYDPRNLAAQQRRIETFVCPSDGGIASIAQGRWPTNYAGVHHSVEAPIDVDNDGILFLNSSVRIRDIVDGTSYTMAVGERMREPGEVWGWASGTRDTLRNSGLLPGGPIALPVPQTAARPRTADEQVLYVGNFTSAHGGIQCALADGSVRFVSGIAPEMCRRDDRNMPPKQFSGW